MSTTYGYGRVSRDSQTSENQRQLIEQQLGMPVDVWYEDHATSGTIKANDRPFFSKMVSEAVAGDTLVFSRVDRISRRASDCLATVEDLTKRGIEVYILQIGKDPVSQPKGKMMLGIFAVFAEDERLSIVERTLNGLNRTKKQGTVLGAKLRIPPSQLKQMCEGRNKGLTLDALSDQHKYDRNTIHRNIKKWGSNLTGYESEWNTRQVQYQKNAA